MMDWAKISAAHEEISLAKEQYKPSWMVGVGYGIRQGRMSDGNSRANMVTAQISVDLPFFTGHRQDQDLQASVYQSESTELNRERHYLELRKELEIIYARWRGLEQRQQLYTQQLMPILKANTHAVVLAYQNATTGLATVLRAYSGELTIELELLKIQLENSKARIALLYFAGVKE